MVRLLEWRKCTQKPQSENRSENAQRAVLCWEAKRKFVHVWLPDINDILMTNFKEAIKGWNLSSWKLYDFSRGRSWSKNHFRTLWLKLNKFCLQGMNPIPFSTVLRMTFATITKWFHKGLYGFITQQLSDCIALIIELLFNQILGFFFIHLISLSTSYNSQRKSLPLQSSVDYCGAFLLKKKASDAMAQWNVSKNS